LPQGRAAPGCRRPRSFSAFARCPLRQAVESSMNTGSQVCDGWLNSVWRTARSRLSAKKTPALSVAGRASRRSGKVHRFASAASRAAAANSAPTAPRSPACWQRCASRGGRPCPIGGDSPARTAWALSPRGEQRRHGSHCFGRSQQSKGFCLLDSPATAARNFVRFRPRNLRNLTDGRKPASPSSVP